MKRKDKISRPAPRRPEARPKLATGFTLTEVLVSMLVLVVGCMAVISMQATGMNAGDRAARMSVATFLAESQIEWLQTMRVDRVRYVSKQPEKLTRDGSVCSGAPGEFCYTRTTLTTCFTPTTRSCEVAVTVEWQAADGSKTLSYDTVVSDVGF